MTTTNPTIDEAFGVPTVPLSQELATIPENQESLPCSFGAFDSAMNPIDPLNEYVFAQTNLKDIIGIGLVAARDLQGFAKKSQAARDFEVLATMLSTVVVANEKLIDMQLKTQKLVSNDKILNDDKQVAENITNNITNNFVGTTNDILSRIREARKILEVDYIETSS